MTERQSKLERHSNEFITDPGLEEKRELTEEIKLRIMTYDKIGCFE
jgi:hypothetical protein